MDAIIVAIQLPSPFKGEGRVGVKAANTFWNGK